MDLDPEPDQLKYPAHVAKISNMLWRRLDFNNGFGDLQVVPYSIALFSTLGNDNPAGKLLVLYHPFINPDENCASRSGLDVWLEAGQQPVYHDEWLADDRAAYKRNQGNVIRDATDACSHAGPPHGFGLETITIVASNAPSLTRTAAGPNSSFSHEPSHHTLGVQPRFVRCWRDNFTKDILS